MWSPRRGGWDTRVMCRAQWVQIQAQLLLQHLPVQPLLLWWQDPAVANVLVQSFVWQDTNIFQRNTVQSREMVYPSQSCLDRDKEKALSCPHGFLPEEFQRPAANNGSAGASQKWLTRVLYSGK